MSPTPTSPLPPSAERAEGPPAPAAPIGHLARLAARALPDTAGLLRRRQTGLFEPAQPEGDAGAWEGAAEFALPFGRSPAPFENPRRARHATEPVTHTAPPAPFIPSPEPLQRAATAQPRPTETRPHAPLQIDATFRPASASARQTPATAQAPAPAATPMPSMRAKGKTALAGDHLTQTPHVAPRDTPSPQAPATEATAAIAASVSLQPQAPAAPLLQTLKPPTLSPVLRARATPSAAVASLASHRAAPPAVVTPRELPPVQVTIGRVEVRVSAPPAAPAERSRRAAPQLSLAQYLDQRSNPRQGGAR